jgi:trimethylamine---corrinoid protein Co-methyltransferase
MAETALDISAPMRGAGTRRRGGRAARHAAIAEAPVVHRPTLVRNVPVTDLLDAEGVEKVHDMAMRIVEEIGVEFRDPESLAIWRRAGAHVEDERVRASREMLMELIATAPSEYDLHARNPERSVRIGGRNTVFSPSYGNPFVRDLSGERRNATLADLDAIQKLTHMAGAVHVAGGPIVEITDVPVPHRHLHTTLSALRWSDKPILGNVTAGERAEDTLAMMRLVFGDDFVAGNAVTTSLINSTSPLVWDGTMLDALRVYAASNQAVLCSPFSMAGASTPASPVGTMAVVAAENVMAIALTQLIRPGAPAVFGCPPMTVALKTGAPVFGHPDSALTQILAGMMARRYGVPHRGMLNIATAKTADLNAGYESMWGAFSAIAAGANWISHAGGSVENTLTLCMGKLVIDHEQVDALYHFASGVAMEDPDELVAAVREVGPGGHFLGSAHTRRSGLFNLDLQNTAPFEQWEQEGCREAIDDGRREARRQLERYEAPAMDPGLAESLDDFVARRSREIDPDIPA